MCIMKKYFIWTTRALMTNIYAHPQLEIKEETYQSSYDIIERHPA